MESAPFAWSATSANSALALSKFSASKDMVSSFSERSSYSAASPVVCSVSLPSTSAISSFSVVVVEKPLKAVARPEVFVPKVVARARLTLASGISCVVLYTALLEAGATAAGASLSFKALEELAANRCNLVSIIFYYLSRRLIY